MKEFATLGERGPSVEAGKMRVTVRTEYAEAHSDPQVWRYVFVYHVRIESVGDETAQLFWRHWRIHDSVAGDHDVQGEGVVGEMPVASTGNRGREWPQALVTLGEPDRALDAIEEVLRTRPFCIHRDLWDPLLGPIWDTPRFRDVILPMV